MKIYQLLMHGYSREMNMMLPEMNNKKRATVYAFRFLAATVVGIFFVFAGTAANAAAKQKGYASAEEAVKAFTAALRSNSDKELLSILGPEATELIFSGDPVRDRQGREGFIGKYDKKNSLVREGEKMVLIIGEKDWPFPIPLVKKGDQWLFDTKAGREELLNRRIGENELSTVQTMLAIVDAEREYAMKDRNGDGVLD
ncbi:MAG: DUF2950 family protein, partial [Candidatus Methylomirabilis sp.]